MLILLDSLNTVLALGGIGLFFAACVIIFDAQSKNWTLKKLLGDHALIIAFFASLGGTAMTLFYSEVLNFVPCGLCWLQRVFLYPQVFILAAALYTKDKSASKFGIVLSVPGLIIALYQHYLQMGGNELITCPITNAGANCAERSLFEFGFMTFPLLSACLFIFLMALYWYELQQRRAI